MEYELETVEWVEWYMHPWQWDIGEFYLSYKIVIWIIYTWYSY
jgi:hypothetical protein